MDKEAERQTEIPRVIRRPKRAEKQTKRVGKVAKNGKKKR